MVLDMEQLRSLVAFADAGSGKGAAQWVHKTPSAVSVHLAKLAQGLGRALLQRQGRRLVLTPDGSELVRYARLILALQGQAMAHFQAPEFVARLRVGLPDDYIPVLMAPLLAALAHVEVVCAPSAELRPLLADGQLDLAILSAEHDLAQRDCLPLALFPEGCIFRKWALTQLRKRQRDHRIVCTSRSMSAIQAAMRTGFAVSLMAESCLPDGAVVLTPRQGFPRLPAVTLILAASPAADPALVQRLGDAMRTPREGLDG